MYSCEPVILIFTAFALMLSLNFAFVIHRPTNNIITVYIDVQDVLCTLRLFGLVVVVAGVYSR